MQVGGRSGMDTRLRGYDELGYGKLQALGQCCLSPPFNKHVLSLLLRLLMSLLRGLWVQWWHPRVLH